MTIVSRQKYLTMLMYFFSPGFTRYLRTHGEAP